VIDTKSRDLSVLVGEVSPGEQRVIGEVDTRNDLAGKDGRSAPREGRIQEWSPTNMGSAERHLLSFCEDSGISVNFTSK
jgi:hypothetical protein